MLCDELDELARRGPQGPRGLKFSAPDPAPDRGDIQVAVRKDRED